MATASPARSLTRRVAPVLLLVAAAVVAAGSAAMMMGRDTEQPVQAEQAVPVQVRGVHALQRPHQLSLSGEVEARQTVQVGFRIGGMVARVAVEEGRRVQEGDLLAELDPEDYRLQLELARAVLDRVSDQYERARQIHAEGRLPAAELTAAETGLREARAHEQLALRSLDNTRLVAPSAGIVARRAVEPGEQVAPGTPVFTLVAVDPVQVRVGVPEREIGRVRVGLPATVTISSLGGWSGQGEIRLVGVVPDPVSRTYAVRISLPNPQGLLRPGMIADVRIREDTEVSALTLPGEAVVRDAHGGTMVFVYFPSDGRVYSRSVTVGSVYEREVEISGGLAGDELVVVGGQHRVRDGSLVEATVMEADASTAPPPPAGEEALP